MSYDIVRGIRIADQKVFLKSASNNVYPKTYSEWECPSLSKILQDQGPKAVDLAILEDYENGNMQPGTKNKYTRAVEVLRHMPEYKAFDWRGNWKESSENRKDKEEYRKLLGKALATQLPAEKYVIVKPVGDTKAYFYHRRNAGFCKWYYDQAKAKIFRFKEDAESTKKWFTNSENWEVVKL